MLKLDKYANYCYDAVMKKHKNSHPSIIGNKLSKTRTAAAGALLTLALAGSTAPSTPRMNARAEAPASNPELARQTLNKNIRDTARGFATRIIDRYANSGEGATRNITERGDESGLYDVNIDIDSPQAGTESNNSRYNLSVTVGKNEFGQLDPSKVRSVFIGLNAEARGMPGSPRDENFYSIGLYNITNDNETGWRVVSHQPGGSAAFESTISSESAGSENVMTLKPERFNDLSGQAGAILELAVAGTPITDLAESLPKLPMPLHIQGRGAGGRPDSDNNPNNNVTTSIAPPTTGLPRAVAPSTPVTTLVPPA